MFSSQADAANKNSDNPDAYLFSILDQVEDYRGSDGSFRFKLCYPELTWGVNGSTCNEWIQSSNPLTESTITGFEPVSLAFEKDGYNQPWSGIGKSPSNLPSSTIDDRPTNSHWFSAIGITTFSHGKIPGPRHSYDLLQSLVTKVHLYVKGTRYTLYFKPP